MTARTPRKPSSLFPSELPVAPAEPVKSRAPGANTVKARLFCDGACSGNPGPGGWGCIVEMDGHREELSGGLHRTTNNQMELQAMIEGLKTLKPGTSVCIVTDSEYVTKGVTSWLAGWVRNGWKSASKQPVKNRELWETIHELLQQYPHVVEWVRGHNGHPENERCDELARAAIQKIIRARTPSVRSQKPIGVIKESRNNNFPK